MWTYNFTNIIEAYFQHNASQLHAIELLLYNYCYKNEFFQNPTMNKWNLIVQNNNYLIFVVEKSSVGYNIGFYWIYFIMGQREICQLLKNVMARRIIDIDYAQSSSCLVLMAK
jgi:hypothetical protein